MLLVLDNTDSFTHNLARLLRLAGAQTTIVRSDAIDAEAVERLGPRGIVLSPGPGRPEDAGCTPEVVRRLAGRTPILGVCLGHQAIGAALGARVVLAPRPMHGHTSPVRHSGEGLFAGAPDPMVVCRYHSLVLDAEAIPAELRVTAVADDGVVMAIEHRAAPLWGVQFHPEAILTEGGDQLIANFLRLAREWRA